MSDLENTIKRDLLLLERAIEAEFISPYEVVDGCMSPTLRDALGSALYAYSANMDALTEEDL